MRKIYLLLLLSILSSVFFATSYDTLTICTQTYKGWSALDSVMVLRDTSLARLDTDTSITITSSNDCVKFRMLQDNYVFWFEKFGYYKDSTRINWTDTSNAEATIYWTLTPWRASLSVGVFANDDADTVMSPLSGIKIDITNSSNDTVYSGYTNSSGTLGLPYDTLVVGGDYCVYADDTLNVYQTDYNCFTFDSTDEFVYITLDSIPTITMNTITLRTLNKGYPIANIYATVVNTTSSLLSDGANYWLPSGTTASETYRSDQDGKIYISVYDNSWVNITVPQAYPYPFAVQFYCTQDTAIGQINIR